MATEKISVFIADDHPVTRAGMVDLLTRHGFRVVGEADSFSATKASCFTKNPDVVLYGLSYADAAPCRSEFDGVQELLKIRKDARILVFTARDSLPAVNAAYKAGAMAVVSKSARPDTVIAAAKAVAAGQGYFMPGMSEKLAEMYIKGGDVDPRDALTKGEMQVFLLLASGKRASEVAKELKLSPITVSNRAVTIRHKLGCERGDFARIAMRFHLIRPES